MNEHKCMSNLKKSFLLYGIQSFILIDGLDFSSRPYDMVVNYKGNYIAIEGKFQKTFNAFGMDKMRDVQIENLDRAVKDNGQAFVVLFIWVPNVTHRAIIWEWEDFRAINRIGSIKKPILEGMPYASCKKYIYDTSELSKFFIDRNNICGSL